MKCEALQHFPPFPLIGVLSWGNEEESGDAPWARQDSQAVSRCQRLARLETKLNIHIHLEMKLICLHCYWKTSDQEYINDKVLTGWYDQTWPDLLHLEARVCVFMAAWERARPGWLHVYWRRPWGNTRLPGAVLRYAAQEEVSGVLGLLPMIPNWAGQWLQRW